MEKAWGHEVGGEVYIDSSVALAVVGRKRNGKLRHVKVRCLCIQEKHATGELRYKKVSGAKNPGDVMAKYLAGGKLEDLAQMMSHAPRSGLAEAGPTLNALGNPGVGRPKPRRSPAEGECERPPCVYHP